MKSIVWRYRQVKRIIDSISVFKGTETKAGDVTEYRQDSKKTRQVPDRDREKIVKQLIITVLVLLILGTAAFSEPGLYLTSDYNAPYNNDLLDANVSFGMNLGFWGIFVASADIYTRFIYGEDDFLHIHEVEALDLYSWGLGIEIPLGDFYFDLDWKNFYTSADDSEINRYSSSYKIGFHVKLTETLGVRAYRRTFHDFSGKSGLSGSGELNMFGAGVMLFL